MSFRRNGFAWLILPLLLGVGLYSFAGGDASRPARAPASTSGSTPSPGRTTEPAAAPTPDEDAPVKTNRLATERSPYLRQHQTNPVDWYPWGDEALARAKEEDKPIFLSVGYSACHWCHVMEHESFEDKGTAMLLNEAFVCVKVDREERPDLDRIYMNAVQVLSGRGGWPMTVLLLPDGRPFWGGTYLPRQSLQELVKSVSKMWKENRKRIVNAAGALSERVQELSDGPDLPEASGSDADLLHHMSNAIAARYDATHGGYGDRPKFPPHTELLFFLDDGGSRATKLILEQVDRTLDAMADGGVHDHVGGGFHRYSTDAAWFLPHFEKMLYDNALLMQAYAAQYARTRDARHRRVVERIAGWLEREMRRPEGGYASALDADTEGEEGLTYTWTLDELTRALGKEDAAWLIAHSRCTTEGNFADEATHKRTGRNILYNPQPLAVLAERSGTSEVELIARLDQLYERLRAIRDKRAQPGLDDKVITAWNGLLISGFVRAGVALDDATYIERARALADVLLAGSRREDGTLLRFPADSGPEIVGFCEDYVHLIQGLLDLARVVDAVRYREAAVELGTRLLAEYEDKEAGGFWTTSAAAHQDLFARSKEIWDSPIPSDNGVAARVCLALADESGVQAFRAAADRTLVAFRPVMGQPRMASGVVALFRALADRMHAAPAEPIADAPDAEAEGRTFGARLWLERTQVALPGRVRFAVELAVPVGSHVGANPAGPGLVATTLGVPENAGFQLDAVVYPPAEAARPVEGQEPVPSWRGRVLLRGALVLPAGSLAEAVTIELTAQVCSDAGTCQLPETLVFSLPLTGSEADGPLRHPKRFALPPK